MIGRRSGVVSVSGGMVMSVVDGGAECAECGSSSSENAAEGVLVMSVWSVFHLNACLV